MFKTFNIFLLASFLFCLISCSNEHKIDSVEETLTEADHNKSNLKKADWDELAQEMKEFETFVEENKTDFSKEEREKANKLIGKYNRSLLEHAVENFDDEIKDLTDQVDGLIENK